MKALQSRRQRRRAMRSTLSAARALPVPAHLSANEANEADEADNLPDDPEAAAARAQRVAAYEARARSGRALFDRDARPDPMAAVLNERPPSHD